VQRLGRVNRRGDGDATVIVVLEPAEEELEAYQAPFERLRRDDRGFDASPAALAKLKQEADRDAELKKLFDAATTPPPLRPALTRALIDAWSLTSLEEHTGRPAIDPWLRGWKDDPPQTSVVWRAHLPIRSGGSRPTRNEIEAFFEAAPPHASEILETEAFRVLKWLRVRGRNVLDRSKSGEEGLPGLDDIVAFVLAPDGALRGGLWLGDLPVGEARAGQETKSNEELESGLRGAMLVVDARLGGLKDGLLEHGHVDSPQTADDGSDWIGEGVVRFRLRFAAAGDPLVADPIWRERLRFAAEVSDEGEVRRWLIVDKWRHDAATEEDRSSARPQLLEEHQSWAEGRACVLAKRLGLDAIYERVLSVSAALHDEGKRASRWQRAFNAPPGRPFAKTRGPIDYALLDGYRHELGSLPRAEADERLKQLPSELQDLVLHLIATHHGFGRPVIGTSGCDDAPPSVVEERAARVALRFARLQRRWGPWGLAWWEALLRAADQQASRDNDAGSQALGAEAN